MYKVTLFFHSAFSILWVWPAVRLFFSLLFFSSFGFLFSYSVFTFSRSSHFYANTSSSQSELFDEDNEVLPREIQGELKLWRKRKKGKKKLVDKPEGGKWRKRVEERRADIRDAAPSDFPKRVVPTNGEPDSPTSTSFFTVCMNAPLYVRLNDESTTRMSTPYHPLVNFPPFRRIFTSISIYTSEP